MANKVRLDCSGCMRPVDVDLDKGTATAKVPSNGKRGSLRTAPYTSETEVSADEILGKWDCPWPDCGYPDSTYLTAQMRKALA